MVLKPTEVVPSTVQLLNVPDVGVPRTGVTRAGLVANTSAPVPVSSVTAAARFADDGVPRNVATPVPNDVIPVPPLATGSVPDTCVANETPDSVPPSVRLPLVVTVPVSVMPLTVPVPLTLVTVPPPPPVASIVILPAPLVMVMPDPAVSVVLVSVLPVVLPMSNSPLV